MEKTTAASILNDRNKIDQLTQYLILSLEAHKQGNPKQLNQIFEELLNDKADLDTIRVWLNIFSKILIDSPRQPSIDCSPLIDFILYNSKWLSCGASNHLQAFEYYAKFCLALVMIRNSYLPLIIKLLVQNLVPKELYEENSRSQSFDIVIGNHSFNNLSDLKQHVTAIIKDSKYDLSSAKETIELDPEHSKFMHELFTHHPKSKQKLRKFSKILIGHNSIGSKLTKCFFIQKQSSNLEDISYIKACNAAYDAFSEKSLDNPLTPEQEALIENILNFLVKIFKIYPLSVNQFPSIVREIFPHRRLHDSIQRVFFVNILKLTLKFEKIKLPILNICLEKIIQIDVEIKPSLKGPMKNELSVEMAKKLDCLMLIFFDYFDFCFSITERNEKNCFGEIPKRPTSAEARAKHLEKLLENFFEMMDIFQANLLMTYQSKYVQYIFYYLCSYVEIYPELMQHFLSRLITNIRSEEEKKFIRINSIHYLRSMIVRAKYIPFPILQKALSFVINYLKSYIKMIRKKISKQQEETKKADKVHFEKIELNASSKYRDRLVDSVAGEQESELKQLFQKYDLFYYLNYAIVYIFSYNSQDFIENGKHEEYQKYMSLLKKYNNFFKTLKFLPLTLLTKFKEATKQFNTYDDETNLLIVDNLDFESENEEKEDEARGDVFLEEYLPYDPNFLSRSKKVILSHYRFLDNEEENADETTGLGLEADKAYPDNGEMEFDCEDDEDTSDNLSSYSKHETDASTDHLKLNSEQTLKRMNTKSSKSSEPTKKLKQNSLYVGN